MTGIKNSNKRSLIIEIETVDVHLAAEKHQIDVDGEPNDGVWKKTRRHHHFPPEWVELFIVNKDEWIKRR